MNGLADAVLVVHAALVLFIVGGLFAIWLGAAFNWRWVRGRGFRGVHLAAIGVVALLALLEHEHFEQRAIVFGATLVMLGGIEQQLHHRLPADALVVACRRCAKKRRRDGDEGSELIDRLVAVFESR
jgi:hypothetical protein